MDERLVTGLTLSFIAHLCTDVTDPWSRNTIREQARCEIRRRCPFITYTEATMLLQRAIKRAQEQQQQHLLRRSLPNNSNTTLPTIHPNPPGTSFSLFSQEIVKGNGSLLENFDTINSPITWEQIQEMENSDVDKLNRLLQVEYIDDILPDWEKSIRPFVQSLLLQQERIHECRLLHQKWFGMTRGMASPEYQMLRLDLTENMIHAMEVKDDVHDVVDVRSCCCIRMALDFFADLVDCCSTLQDQTRRNTFGNRLWVLMWRNPTNRTAMIQHDPMAVGFSQWIMYCTTPGETMTLVTNQHSALSELFHTARVFTESIIIGDQTTLRPTTMIDDCCFCLSILRSILVSTRAAYFPWQVMMSIETECNKHSGTSLEPLMLPLVECYCKLMYTTLHMDEANEIKCFAVVTVCADALDTMVSGCMKDSSKVLMLMKNEIKAIKRAAIIEMNQFQAKSLSTSLLQRILDLRQAI